MRPPIKVLPTRGSWGWLGLVVYIAAFDVLSKETLSVAFTNALRCPRRRPWVVISTAYIVLHLYSGIPVRYDPLRRFDALIVVR